jgi:phosphatidylglycerophosphate synthase
MQPLVPLNAPNVISLSRLLLAACFVVSNSTHLRLGLLLAAGASDVLDGWLARRRHLESRAGALIDAVSDRGFVLVAVAVLFYDAKLSTGEVLVLMSRDIATALGFLVARAVPWLRKVTFKARLVGKAVTLLQYATIASALLLAPYTTALLVLLATASAVAITDYTLALWRAAKSQ